MSNPFESKFIHDAMAQTNHVVYIVNRKFFGYDPKNANYLREFSRDEVKQWVITAFNTQVFVEDVITQDTTLLVVPDHWNRALPRAAKPYEHNLLYVPFSYVLHYPVKSHIEIARLQVPPDAEYQIMMRDQKKIPPESFILKQVAPDDIMREFQGYLFAAAKRMEPMKRSLTRKTSSKKSSLQRKAPPAWSAKAGCMSAMTPSMMSEKNADKMQEEYDQAWQNLLNNPMAKQPKMKT